MPTIPSSSELKAKSLARNWPELHRRVIRGQANGQVLWQPRILAWREHRRFYGVPLPEPYEHLSVADMYRYLDCSNRLYEFNECFRLVEHPAVRRETKEIGHHRTLTVIRTPVGEQTTIEERRPSLSGAIPVKREIVTKDDLRVATWRAENAHYEYDQEVFDRLMQEVGDLGLPTMYIPRVNVQDLYINTMGVENAIYALHDWGPETFRPYFQALDNLHDQLIDLLNSLPQFEFINFGDNLHGATLSPALFEEYVLPTYRHRCERLHRAGKFVHAHWDGEVRQLLPFARETGLDGIEAITPQPQGDVTLEEVKEALGDELFLIDGIPAVYFDETYSPEVLADCVHELIRLFAPRLIFGISDEMSYTGDIERIRLVGQIVDEYNASLAKPQGIGLTAGRPT